jgi:hypothetical protein
MNYYPDNTVAKYKTRLANPISLTGDWEVGLVEIEFRRSWMTVGKDGNKFRFNHVEAGKSYSDWLSITPGYYNTPEDIVDAMNYEFQTMCAKLKRPPLEKMPVFKYDRFRHKVTAIVHAQHRISNFSNDLRQILGIRSENSPVPWSYENDRYWIAEDVCDLQQNIQSLYVYCDVLEHVPVGDVKAPLLRTVSVTGKPGETIRCVYDKAIYVPVQKKNFDSLEINIKTDAGEDVPFESGKSLVTLHFRLAKNSYFLQ